MLCRLTATGWPCAREAINYANNTEFVVPGKTLSEVLKLLKDSEGEVEICPSPPPHFVPHR